MSGTNALLADFVRNGSELAFRDLVAGYLDLVFSTALRLVDRDKHLAEDISQDVFVDLARKAVELPKDVQLGGWLYCHTCFLARKAMRRERRRRGREFQAMEMLGLADFTEENLRKVGGVLDEAINELKVEDRTAILLRFFEQLDFSSIGTRMECSEDAARMRVARAVDKLGITLRRRGVTLSAAGLIFVLTTKITSAAPIGLAGQIAHVSFVAASKAGFSFALLKELCLTRLNIGLVSASVAVVLTVMLFLPRDREPSEEWQRNSSIAKPAVSTDSKVEVVHTATPEKAKPRMVPSNPVVVRVATAPGKTPPVSIRIASASTKTSRPVSIASVPATTGSHVPIPGGAVGASSPGPYDDFLNSLVSTQPKNYNSVSNLLSLALASTSGSTSFPEAWASNAATINLPVQDRRVLRSVVASVLDSVKSVNEAVADDEPASKDR